MKIKENYKQDENQVILEGDNGLSYLVNYEENITVEEGIGYIEYNLPPDNGSISFDVDIIDCFVVDEDIEFVTSCSNQEKKIIRNYMIDLVEIEYQY
mgnify:FL=1|tara:strand:- start:390 stop:680 length:291 start_codon:yes stop_codon:yes gene_type:complete